MKTMRLMCACVVWVCVLSDVHVHSLIEFQDGSCIFCKKKFSMVYTIERKLLWNLQNPFCFFSYTGRPVWKRKWSNIQIQYGFCSFCKTFSFSESWTPKRNIYTKNAESILDFFSTVNVIQRKTFTKNAESILFLNVFTFSLSRCSSCIHSLFIFSLSKKCIMERVVKNCSVSYKCKKCNFDSKTFGDVFEHVKNDHAVNIPRERWYRVVEKILKCDVCGFLAHDDVDFFFHDSMHWNFIQRIKRPFSGPHQNTTFFAYIGIAACPMYLLAAKLTLFWRKEENNFTKSAESILVLNVSWSAGVFTFQHWTAVISVNESS